MVHPSAILGTVFSFVLSVGASPTAYNSNRVNKLAVQGHRGGLGYRPESKCSTFTVREIEVSIDILISHLPTQVLCGLSPMLLNSVLMP